MDKAQALSTFWRSFGLEAYDENTVPAAAKLPYITYEVATSSFDDGDIPLIANLWYYGKSWAEIQQKAEQISQYIGMGGYIHKTDTGYVWFKRRSPFAQRMRDNDENTRRILLSVSVEFIDY